jgi:hypothetical protein
MATSSTRRKAAAAQASGWAQYPFLRMPNVQLEPGLAGSPTPEQIIADTKDGVLIRDRAATDRPAALQRPLRRRVLGDQERKKVR